MLMLKGMVAIIRRLDSKPHLYLGTFFKWPRYPQSWNKVDKVNQGIAELALENRDITLIDNRPLFQQQGQPVDAVFRGDGTNLNDWGYAQLTLLTRQQMELDYPLLY